MADRIRVTGPIRDWVDDAEDEDGTTLPGYWQRCIFVEATGTDGVVYGKSCAFGDKISEEYVPQFIEFGKKILQRSMEADGVW